MEIEEECGVRAKPQVVKDRLYEAKVSWIKEAFVYMLFGEGDEKKDGPLTFKFSSWGHLECSYRSFDWTTSSSSTLGGGYVASPAYHMNLKIEGFLLSLNVLP